MPAWLRTMRRAEPRRARADAVDRTTAPRSCARPAAARTRRHRAAARHDRAPADAVAAGCCRRAPRARRAQAFLARAAKDFAARSATRSLEQVLALLERCALRARCSRRAAAREVPIVGRLAAAPAELAVTGQVDRLVVTRRRSADRRLQNQSPAAAQPRREVPPCLCPPARALPRGADAALPGPAVRARLVWTEVPDLMELPRRRRWTRRLTTRHTSPA